jgi:DNA transposition AAA+ family ATPase
MSSSLETLTADPNQFILTKEYRRFAEFCDACRSYRYIGLCYGPPGVGKTLSARRYAQWDFLEPLVSVYLIPDGTVIPPEVLAIRTVLYTPAVANTPGSILRDVHRLRCSLTWLRQYNGSSRRDAAQWASLSDCTELIIVDEADRLKMLGLEQMRDIYDRANLGLILIGMPGIEKRLARYPQLYSRVGFVHQFRSLNQEEVRFVLKQRWQQWKMNVGPDGFADTEGAAAIIRITSGNFRLMHRLLMQIERILQINDLQLVTKEVVEAARENLVIGVV